MKNSVHPGGFAKTEIIEPLGLSVTDAARFLGVTRAALSTSERARVPLAGYGDPDRKGVRRFDGNAHADAEQFTSPGSRREGEIEVDATSQRRKELTRPDCFGATKAS